jgi:hypothetical protein
MERRFYVEAKKFFFSMREDKAEFCLEERRKDFVGFVFLGVQCSVWLVDMVEGVEVSGYRRCQFLSWSWEGANGQWWW